MKTKLIVMFAPVAAAVLLATASIGLTQTNLRGSGKAVRIDIQEGFVSPSEVALAPGTTVIWFNATDKIVHVNFGMGERVKKACTAPVGFKLVGNSYRASNVPPGGVASLCFLDPGGYGFSVIPSQGGVEGSPPAAGTIIIRRAGKTVS